jgi:phospholipase C
MRRISFLLTMLLLPFATHAADKPAVEKLAQVKHIVVFYLENHSFDNLFGTFPGADGIADLGEKAVQVDVLGKPYDILPRVIDGKNPDARFPERLANKPFLITDYVPVNDKIGDLVHRFYQLQEQIDGGKMDRFALISNAGGLAMGHYDGQESPIWDYAKRYTLADHFFTGAFGGSMLNHFWLICACTPRYEHAPAMLHAVLDGKGKLVKDGQLTPDGYAVNTIEPFNPPYNAKATDGARRLPPSNLPTIGERLSEKHIGWAWYGGGWNDAVAGMPGPLFQFHHQPFAYFSAYGPTKKARKEHLKDENDFIAAIETDTLPAVAFYKPNGEVDLHPGYARLKESEDHVFALVRKIEQSPSFKDTIVIVTFDDTGGFWDHVAPPKGDRFGPGERIPAVIISPFAKKGFVDHTTYDTTSILKLIETKYDLKPLTDRDAKANDLTNALE